MPRCRHCGTTVPTEDLVSHRNRDLLVVHCPECKGPMGTYREP